MKEFFNVETKAILVSAFLTYEGIESVDNFTMDILPETVDKSLRRWLHGRINLFLQTYVMPIFEHLSAFNLGREFPCSYPKCMEIFKFDPIRKLHEKTGHRRKDVNKRIVYLNTAVQDLVLVCCYIMLMIL